MKKITVLFVIVCIAAGSVFAQNYSVQNVTGKVQREAGSGMVDVKAGDTLTADTVIHTGLGASLVLKDGDKTLTIAAGRKGKVGELASAASGVRINGNVVHADTSAGGRTTAQVSTAAARASDAAADDDIAAE